MQKAKKRIGQVIFVLVVFAGIYAKAADYYVSQLTPGASDNNPGTEKKPFKSINGALSRIQLKPNDSLWIRNGTYREFVWIESKGYVYHKRWRPVIQKYTGISEAEPIKIAAFPGHKPVIKGSDLVSGWKKFKDNIWVRDWDENSQQVFADGSVLRQIGGKMSPHLSGRRWKGRLGDNVNDMFAGSFYYDLEKKKLYIWLKDNKDPNKCQIEVSIRPATFWLGARTKAYKYMIISGLIFEHCNSSIYNGWPSIMLKGNHNVMENCEANWSDGGGISVKGDSHAIISCKFNHNGRTGMGASLARGLRVINCETSYNNYRLWSAFWHAGGCKFIPYCHDMIVRGHTAAYNYASPGIWFDGWQSNVTIEDCVAHHNGGPGIMYEIGNRGVIKNNISYENKQRGIYVSNSTYTGIYHNLVYRNGMSGIAVVGVNRKDGGLFGRGPENIIPGGHNIVWGNILEDNCWPELAPQKSWTRRPELIMPPEEGVHKGNISDYNVFYRSGERKKWKLYFGHNWACGFAKSFKEWQQKTGMDTHSIIAKPLYKDQSKYDFHPVKGSPVLWMVKPDMNVLYDFDKQERERNRYFTAGPFKAPKGLLKLARKTAKCDKYKFVALDKLKKSGRHHTFYRDGYFTIRGIVNTPVFTSIAPGITGFKLDEVPFRMDSSFVRKFPYLDKNCRKISVDINSQVKNIYILCTAFSKNDKPLVKCTIVKDDGTSEIIQWQNDKKGLTSIPRKSTHTKEVWQGKEGKKVRHLFLTKWQDDNEWYAVKKLNFELVDPNATFCIFAITNEGLK